MSFVSTLETETNIHALTAKNKLISICGADTVCKIKIPYGNDEAMYYYMFRHNIRDFDSRRTKLETLIGGSFDKSGNGLMTASGHLANDLDKFLTFCKKNNITTLVRKNAPGKGFTGYNYYHNGKKVYHAKF